MRLDPHFDCARVVRCFVDALHTRRYAYSHPRRGCFHFCPARSSRLSEEERQHIQRPLPPGELLNEAPCSDIAPDRSLSFLSNDSSKKVARDENDVVIPGDSFGIMRNRNVFYRPVQREPPAGELGALMPTGTHPLMCYNVHTVRALSSSCHVPQEAAWRALGAAGGDVNIAMHHLLHQHDLTYTCSKESVVTRVQGPGRDETAYAAIRPRFGLVALEAYAPETFCLVSFTLPSLAATRDDTVLDAIHELALSAAELPLDTPPADLVHTFVQTWTTEDEVPCKEILDALDIGVEQIVLLPYGEYAVQGFHVAHPVKPDTPNIGTSAAACCLDLRTGIHNRFRFHVERIADTLSEHVVRERIHYHQDVHLLRQPYWFRPEYSVEEFIRFKESLLQPSAAIFEMRYASLCASPYALANFRNVVELEKLKIAQHKYEKHYEDFTTPGKCMTSDNMQLQTVAAVEGGATLPGATLHQLTNAPTAPAHAMETRAGPLRKVLANSMQAHGDRVFARFYRNNYH